MAEDKRDGTQRLQEGMNYTNLVNDLNKGLNLTNLVNQLNQPSKPAGADNNSDGRTSSDSDVKK